MVGAFSLPMIVVIVLVVMFLASAIRILNEYERAVSGTSKVRD
jgi:regulator of protease activity HflC (stomatin/prohibitin superfamily)